MDFYEKYNNPEWVQNKKKTASASKKIKKAGTPGFICFYNSLLFSDCIIDFNLLLFFFKGKSSSSLMFM